MGSIHTCLDSINIFKDLSEDTKMELSQEMRHMYLKNGQQLYSGGQYGSALFVVVSGHLDIYKENNGVKVLIRTINEGDFDGEYSLLYENKHETTAIAHGETKVCMLKREDFLKVLNEHNGIALEMMEVLAKRLELADLRATISYLPIDERVEQYLKQIMDENRLVMLPKKKRDIAEDIGTTAESLSRSLATLVNNGKLKKISNKIYKFN